MNKLERFRIAYARYKKRLKKNGSSDMAMNIALSAGIDFLSEYENADKEEK